MALGDGIRRNIASVDPMERALFRDALVALNRQFFPGKKTDSVPGGVSFWFKQDEIHHATHVHDGPEFLPWHREIVNKFEEMLRKINSQLSLHYWDWTQDPRSISNANLGGGKKGKLNLFTSDFMGHGGSNSAPLGEPWLRARYYVPNANPHRDLTENPADPPNTVVRSVNGSPATVANDDAILKAVDYATMRRQLERIHNDMHGFVSMGGAHISFRDPFVFLLHSNVDRLFAMWQTDAAHPKRLVPETVYGSESDNARLNSNVEPWSTGHSFDQFGQEHFTRPWFAPENQGVPHTYKHHSIVTPPAYDTMRPVISLPGSISFGKVPQKNVATRVLRISNTGAATLSLSIKASPPPPQGQPLSGFRWASANIKIAPRKSRDFVIEFTPRAQGSFSSTLKVVSNAAGSPHSVRLGGIGLPRNVQPF